MNIDEPAGLSSREWVWLDESVQAVGIGVVSSGARQLSKQVSHLSVVSEEREYHCGCKQTSQIRQRQFFASSL